MKQAAFDEYIDLIETKGGTVIDTFFIKTLWKDSSEIKKAAQAVLTERVSAWVENTGKK
jgi:hypothetical protein